MAENYKHNGRVQLTSSQSDSMTEPSPELEAFFELCKRMYLRLEAEGKWDETIDAMRADRLKREAEEFESPNG